MNGHFVFVLCLMLLVLFAGGIFGCSAAIFIRRLRRKPAANRATAVCFLLTLSVIAGTAMILFGDWRDGFGAMQLTRQELVLYGSCFAAGTLIAVLDSVLVPVGIVLYLALTSFCLHSLSRSFDQQQTLAILKVQKQSFTVDDTEFQADFSGRTTLKVNVCHVPDTLIVPIPRVWYELYDGEFRVPQSSFAPLNCFYRFLYSEVQLEEFDMPYPLAYLDVYSVLFSKKGGTLSVQFVKAF